MSCPEHWCCAERRRISSASPREDENTLLSTTILAAPQPRKTAFSVAIIISLLCSTHHIFQFADAWASMQFQLPNGQHVYRNGKHWPAIGHEIHDYKNRMATAGGGSQLNAFGKMMKVEGMHWTQITCNADADGDGYTNGEELGDPDCIWTKGQVPTRTTDISHPGYKDSFPATFKSKSQIAAEAIQKEFDEVEALLERRASETNELMDRLLKRKRGEQQRVGPRVSSFSDIEVSEEDVEKEHDAENDGQNAREGQLPLPSSEYDDLVDVNQDVYMHGDFDLHDGGCPASSTTDMMYDAEQFKFLENEYIESRLRAIEREVRRKNGVVFELEEIILAREEAEMQKRIADFQLSLSKRRFEASEREREETRKEVMRNEELSVHHQIDSSSDNFNHQIFPESSVIDDPLYSSLEMPSAETISKLLMDKPNRTDNQTRLNESLVDDHRGGLAGNHEAGTVPTTSPSGEGKGPGEKESHEGKIETPEQDETSNLDGKGNDPRKENERLLGKADNGGTVKLIDGVL